MTRNEFTRAALMLMALAAAPVGAATDLPLPRFKAVSLEGGGHVVVRHGAAPRARLLRGSTEVSSFRVEDNALEIRACDDRCPPGYRLEVEVALPTPSALAVSGGGKLEATGFPPQPRVALAVSGGGMIDAHTLEARQIAAAVDGGGVIRTGISQNLAASVRGGGNISYRGDPSIATSVRGGGRVTRSE